MAYRQRHPKQTAQPAAMVVIHQGNGRGPGNLAGLDERSRRAGVKGFLRYQTWAYPKQPIDRAAEMAARQGARRAA